MWEEEMVAWKECGPRANGALGLKRILPWPDPPTAHVYSFVIYGAHLNGRDL
jgi:hypothetical protein